MSHRERLEPPAVTALERQLLVAPPSLSSRPNIQSVPPSSVLSKLKTFLPQLQQANEQLEQQLQSGDASAVDIEHIPEGTDAPVIQMDLACGLLELKDDAALAAAQRAIAAGADVAVEAYDGGGDSCSDGDSSSEDGDGDSSNSSESDPSSRSKQADAEDTATQGGIAGTLQAAAGSSDGTSEQEQQHRPGNRRKVKAKRPMIVELS